MADPALVRLLDLVGLQEGVRIVLLLQPFQGQEQPVEMVAIDALRD